MCASRAELDGGDGDDFLGTSSLPGSSCRLVGLIFFQSWHPNQDVMTTRII